VGPIPPAQARHLKPALASGSPEVVFSLDDDGTIRWKEAHIQAGGKQYAAALTDVDFKPQHIETVVAAAEVPAVDLDKLRVAPEGAAAAVNVSYSENPEIARLQRKLYAARKKKARSEAERQRIAALKRELAKLQATEGKAQETGPTEVSRKLLARLPKATRVDRDAVAVIIGNRSYSKYHRDVPDVLYAHNDAEAMKQYVIHTLGYREGNVLYAEDATQATLTSLFGTEKRRSGKLANRLHGNRSDIFIYYSGHGAPGLSDHRGYLVPVDADPATLEINGYPLEILYNNLAALPAHSITVVIDACFSGSSAGGAVVQGASDLVIRAADPRQRLSGATVITASGPDQVASWDKQAHLGLLTRYFLEGVTGAADTKAFGNGDGRVTVSEVKKYLNEEVPYDARKHYGRDQEPQITGKSNRVLAVVQR